MSSSKDVNPEVSTFVDRVMNGKDAAAADVLERIVKRKVEKHIRKTLRSSAGR